MIDCCDRCRDGQGLSYLYIPMKTRDGKAVVCKKSATSTAATTVGSTVSLRASRATVESATYDVVLSRGVQWRRSPAYEDRLEGNGPVHEQSLKGLVVRGADGLEYLEVRYVRERCAQIVIRLL